MKLFIIVIFTAIIACYANAVKPEDFLVENLPSMNGTVPFKIYSGYLPADDVGKKFLFFMLTLSQRSLNDPVLVWSNGGPGCSSMEGLFNENGPFVMGYKGKSLTINEYSWNRVASTLYIEYPIGVGFSYSNDLNDLNIGDAQTSKDVLTFLLNFFNVFTFLNKGQGVYLSGESYAGHYTPNLAMAISKYNVNPDKYSGLVINLKGILVGDPWTDPYQDNYGTVEYWQGHHIISDTNAKCLFDNCDFNTVGPLSTSSSTVNPTKCNKCADEVHDQMSSIWIYNIFADMCYETVRTSGSTLMRHLSKRGPLSAYYSRQVEQLSSYNVHDGRSPCDDVDMGYYLNRFDVQQALHVKTTKWMLCSDSLNYSESDVLSSVMPTYDYLLHQTNMDAIVPFTGTRRWISNLKLGTPTVEFSQWIVDKQAGGFVTEWNEPHKFTFTTVRGAGHMVPSDQGARAFYMVACRLSGQSLTKCDMNKI